jgi:hypothetical protein
MKQRRIKFKRVKLGRQKVWGHADDYPLHIDDRLKGKKELEIYVHESMHYLWPGASEQEIERKAILLTNTLWHEGYRKVDNSNNIPLQDGQIHE